MVHVVQSVSICFELNHEVLKVNPKTGGLMRIKAPCGCSIYKLWGKSLTRHLIEVHPNFPFVQRFIKECIDYHYKEVK